MTLPQIILALGEAIETRIAALEARPTDPEIIARVAALEAEIATLRSFDQQIRDL